MRQVISFLLSGLVLTFSPGCAQGERGQAESTMHEAQSPALRDEVVFLVGSYLEAARAYDRDRLIRSISRRQLEFELGPLLRDGELELLKRRQMLALRRHAFFANHCVGVLATVTERENEVLAKAHIYFSDQVMPMEFVLIREGGELRVDGVREQPSEPIERTSPDFDFCEVPINWDNPALLKEGESKSQQEARLGLPEVT